MGARQIPGAHLKTWDLSRSWNRRHPIRSEEILTQRILAVGRALASGRLLMAFKSNKGLHFGRYRGGPFVILRQVPCNTSRGSKICRVYPSDPEPRQHFKASSTNTKPSGTGQAGGAFKGMAKHRRLYQTYKELGPNMADLILIYISPLRMGVVWGGVISES